MISIPSPGGAPSPELSTSSPGGNTSPEPSGAAGPADRHRRCLTLACPEVSEFPSVHAGLPEEEDQSFVDGMARTPIDTDEVGTNLAEVSSTDSLVLQSINEVAYHECIMAGFSSEEALAFVKE